MKTGSVAIAGAGIAGLAAALAFARYNIRVDLIEQAEVLSETGAGLQLSPNATRLLGSLGLLTEIESAWFEPADIRLLSGKTLKPLATVPAGGFARARWGAPYGVIHRAELQRILLSAVGKSPFCTLHTGRKLTSNDSGAITAVTGSKPDLVIGADGVWSRMRGSVPGSGSPRFSGHVAWRFLCAAADDPVSPLPGESVTAFLGPGVHLVAYPLNDRGLINVVAITGGSDPGRGWEHTVEEQMHDGLVAAFSRWHPAIANLIAGAQGPTRWPLYEVAGGRWHDGRSTVLIGDAAHAMTPFAAQGAAMAIEDAFELAGLAANLALPDALEAFEKARQPRIRRVRSRAAFNRFAYHARGPVRIVRDLVLSARSPQSLAEDFDWLYGYGRAED